MCGIAVSVRRSGGIIGSQRPFGINRIVRIAQASAVLWFPHLVSTGCQTKESQTIHATIIGVTLFTIS
jgi:hypothetical protein